MTELPDCTYCEHNREGQCECPTCQYLRRNGWDCPTLMVHAALERIGREVPK